MGKEYLEPVCFLHRLFDLMVSLDLQCNAATNAMKLLPFGRLLPQQNTYMGRHGNEAILEHSDMH